MTRSNGFSYILTMMCLATRYAIAVATSTTSAERTAKILLDRVILVFGTFNILRCDNAKGFRSTILKQLTKLLNIKRHHGAPWHPQSQGNIERFHSPLITSIRSYCHENPRTWQEYLPAVVFAYNSSPHSATGIAPNQAIFSYVPTPPLFMNLKPPSTGMVGNIHLRLREMGEEISHNRRLAVERDKNLKIKNKNYCENGQSVTKEYALGELVWAFNFKRKQGRSKKLTEKYLGPYQIVEIMDTGNTYRIATLGKRKVPKVVHAKMLKPFIHSEFVPQEEVILEDHQQYVIPETCYPEELRNIPLTKEINEEEFLVAERLVDKRTKNKKTEYKVRWQDADADSDEWKLEEEITNHDLIEEFERHQYREILTKRDKNKHNEMNRLGKKVTFDEEKINLDQNIQSEQTNGNEQTIIPDEEGIISDAHQKTTKKKKTI